MRTRRAGRGSQGRGPAIGGLVGPVACPVGTTAAGLFPIIKLVKKGIVNTCRRLAEIGVARRGGVGRTPATRMCDPDGTKSL